MKPFLIPQCKWLLCPLAQHIACTDQNDTQDIIYMFLFIICNILLPPIVYMLVSPPDSKFLEGMNHVLFIFAHSALNTLKMLSLDTAGYQSMR